MNTTDDEKLLNALFDNIEDDEHYQDVAVPAGLQQRLHAIAKPENNSKQGINVKHFHWRAISSIAASAILAVCLFSLIPQQQYSQSTTALSEAEQARHDLRLAFNHLNKSVNRAQQKAQPHIMKSLSHNLNKAAIAPVFSHTKNTTRI